MMDAVRLQRKADAGVGRGPGGPPYLVRNGSRFLTHSTRFWLEA
jgi:hypothetical protein